MCVYTDLLERLLDFQFFYVKVDTMVILQVTKFWDLNVWLCVSTGVEFIESSEYQLRRKGFTVFHQPLCKELCVSFQVVAFRSSAVGSVLQIPEEKPPHLKISNLLMPWSVWGGWEHTDFTYLYCPFLVLGPPNFSNMFTVMYFPCFQVEKNLWH